MNTDDDELLTDPEVAQVLRCSTDALRHLRHRGGGPAVVRIGRRVLTRRGDLRAFLAENRVEPATSRPELVPPATSA